MNTLVNIKSYNKEKQLYGEREREEERRSLNKYDAVKKRYEDSDPQIKSKLIV